MAILLKFLLGPIGRWVGAAIGLLVVVGFIYGAGVRHERAKWKEAVAAEKARQERVIADVVADAETRQNRAEAENVVLEQKVKKYEDELAKRPSDRRCILSPADAKRLQSIR